MRRLGEGEKTLKVGAHELSERQKLSRFEICSSLFLRNKTDPFLDRIITRDEKWILYDSKRRYGQWLNADETSGILQGRTSTKR